MDILGVPKIRAQAGFALLHRTRPGRGRTFTVREPLGSVGSVGSVPVKTSLPNFKDAASARMG